MNANIAELMCEPWCIRKERLEAFLGAVSAHQPAQVRTQGPFLRANPMKVEGGVATVSISGILLKSVPQWVRYNEIDATGYDEIAEDLQAAVADPEVKSIRLLVDSPGGQLSGITEAAAAIEAAGKLKPITADVLDGAYSAAYWLASQAKNIVASPTAGIGSIGTFLTLTDLSALAERIGVKVHLVTSGRHKGVGASGVRIEHDQLEPFQRFVDDATDMFVAAVAKGRKVSAETVRGWATGEFWMAAEAQNKGLIDGVWSPSAVSASRSTAIHGGAVFDSNGTSSGVPAAAIGGVSPVGEGTMDQQELAAAQAKAKGEAVEAERQRMADLKTAFPGEAAFVMEQYEKGATVNEAKAAFSDVLRGRLEASQKENEKLRAQAPEAPPAPSGPPPAENRGSGQQGGGDFMQVAKADQHAHAGACIERIAGRKSECCGIVAAMSRTAKAQPELHREYLAAQRGRAAEVHERKVKLGMTGPFARA